MIQRSIKRLNPRALVVGDELASPTAEGRAARALAEELQGRAIEVVEAASAEDGTSVIVSDSAIHANLMAYYVQCLKQGVARGHADISWR
jgi:arginine decarboxylase